MLTFILFFMEPQYAISDQRANTAKAVNLRGREDAINHFSNFDDPNFLRLPFEFRNGVRWDTGHGLEKPR